MDVRDWIIVGFVGQIQVSATIFLFKHYDPVNFATWATICSTLTAAYHYICYRDQKVPDNAGAA